MISTDFFLKRNEITYGGVLAKGFEVESFSLKFNPLTFEYKIHSIEVDLNYFKYL